MKTSSRKLSLAHAMPRYWPTWIIILFFAGMSFLPHKYQYALGKRLGNLARHLLKKRVRIARTNLALCFPKLSESQREDILKQHFESLGIGLFETSFAWFRSPHRLKPITRVIGINHLIQAKNKGKGVILLGGHFTTLDLGGALFTLFSEADVMQRDHKNPVINYFMTKSRSKYYNNVFNKDELKGVLKSLKAGHTVWYATDQDYGNKGTVFAPFFGVPASTLTTTARIAQKTGAAVIPFSHFREEDNSYTLYFDPPLSNYPSGNELLDATATNHALETAILRHPEQYFWVHRRFKSTPAGKTSEIYSNT